MPTLRASSELELPADVIEQLPGLSLRERGLMVGGNAVRLLKLT